MKAKIPLKKQLDIEMQQRKEAEQSLAQAWKVIQQVVEQTSNEKENHINLMSPSIKWAIGFDVHGEVSPTEKMKPNNQSIFKSVPTLPKNAKKKAA